MNIKITPEDAFSPVEEPARKTVFVFEHPDANDAYGRAWVKMCVDALAEYIDSPMCGESDQPGFTAKNGVALRWNAPDSCINITAHVDEQAALQDDIEAITESAEIAAQSRRTWQAAVAAEFFSDIAKTEATLAKETAK